MEIIGEEMNEELLIKLIISCFTIAMFFGVIDIVCLTIAIIKSLKNKNEN